MIARAGIGAITDAVTYSVPILAVGENENPELVFNAQKVESLGFGINLFDFMTEAAGWVQQLNNSERFVAMQKKLQDAPRSGLEAVVEFFIQHFNLGSHESH